VTSACTLPPCKIAVWRREWNEGNSEQRMNPQAKKALAYQRDHRIAAEYPHQFRRSWPRKEARLNRRYRRRVQQLLDAARQYTPEQQADLSVIPVRRYIARKQGVVPLGEWVEGGTFGHAVAALRHFFAQPYNLTLHRDRFAILVTAAMAGHGLYAHSIARYLNEILPDPPLPIEPNRQWRTRSSSERYWLAAFLDDSPGWNEQLRAWIILMARGERPTATD
jgi:hypothetical protein